MKMKKEQDKQYVGIDLSKKTLQAVRLSQGNEKEWFKTKTDERGIQTLLNWLSDSDVVALEAGNQSFRLVKRITKSIGCEVIILNPSDLAVIYKSLKKTDREDALKLARLIQRIPREELPEVALPSELEEKTRQLESEYEHWIKSATKNKNRLHSIFTREGLTTVTKADIKTHKKRTEMIQRLPNESSRLEAERLLAHLSLIEETIKEIKKKMHEVLKENHAYTKKAMSLPGVGPIVTISLLGYMGDFSRFSHPKQSSNYVALIPKVAISGKMVHYGHIINRGCKPVKKAMIQAAWALLRSGHGGELRTFYENLAPRIGKKKAIVALARKMIEVLTLMFHRDEMYKYMPVEKLEEKLLHYGLTI